MFRTTDSGNRISSGGWTLRGLAVILLAAGIGTAAVIWLVSSGDAAKTAPSQSEALAQTAPSAAVSPELTPLLQSMVRDLVSAGKEIEKLKASREQMSRDNANLSEQLKASQEQLSRVVVRLSEQLKTGQEQAARDNATVAEQIKGIQDQLARVISQQKTLPKIAATSPRLPPRPARPEGPAALKPVPTVSSAPASAKPKAERPKLSSAPPAPAR
jgi:Skp family chaperone for outer membrane proteins